VFSLHAAILYFKQKFIYVISNFGSVNQESLLQMKDFYVRQNKNKSNLQSILPGNIKRTKKSLCSANHQLSQEANTGQTTECYFQSESTFVPASKEENTKEKH
jgi:hypothetical protein